VTAAPEAALAFGIDIGGTKVLGVALDATDRVVAETRVPTPRQGPAPGAPVGTEVVDAVLEVLGQLRGAPTVRSLPGSAAVAVGVGAPGMVDHAGRLCFAPNLRWATGAELGRLLADRVPGPRPVIDNDANLAVFAEHRLGAARGFDEVVMVTLGTGIGGGLLQRGRVVVGARGFAGEIGHMIVDPGGPQCPCGRQGCWERLASGDGLGRLARDAAVAGRLDGVVARAGGDAEAVRGEHVSAAARDGDPEARAVFDQLGYWVALGLSNLCAVSDPACFVLGGGLAGAGELLLAPTIRSFSELVEGAAQRPPIEIRVATLGERSGAVGAALAARAGGLR
jgi:glucokinase